MNNRLTKHDLLLTLIVSTAFVVLVELSIKVLNPLQDALVGDFQYHALLLYLPHGVRVLAAWLYGWKSILYLLPGQLISNILFWNSGSLLSIRFLDVISGASVGYIGILAAAYVLQNNKTFIHQRPWVEIVLAGIVASFANSAIKSLLYDIALKEAFAFLIGDILGLIVLMLILLYVFKIERQVTSN